MSPCKTEVLFPLLTLEWSCSTACPAGAGWGTPVCCVGCHQRGWIEKGVLNPCFWPSLLIEICPLVPEKYQEGFSRGERSAAALGKRISHVSAEHFISETLLQGSEPQNPCFLREVLSGLANHLTVRFSKLCSVCLQRDFPAFAYFQDVKDQGNSGLKKIKQILLWLKRDKVWYGAWKHVSPSRSCSDLILEAVIVAGLINPEAEKLCDVLVVKSTLDNCVLRYDNLLTRRKRKKATRNYEWMQWFRIDTLLKGS